jgi:hypothetical protein
MTRQTQSQGQQAPKEKVILTTEAAISEIRKLRAGRLFVGNMEYVDHLLAAYDAAIAENSKMSDTINQQAVVITDLTNNIDRLATELVFDPVTNIVLDKDSVA